MLIPDKVQHVLSNPVKQKVTGLGPGSVSQLSNLLCLQMCSPSMTSETTREFAGALSKVTGSADPVDLGTLPEPTVHCNRVSIEDYVQHIFRFFVLRSSQREPRGECSSTDGGPPPKTPETLPRSDGASTSTPAADLPATSREGELHLLESR